MPEPSASARPDCPSPPPVDLAAWYLRSHHRLFWNLVLCLAILPVFVMLMSRGVRELAQANLVESEKRLRVLNHPEVPDDENAAILYDKATKAQILYSGPAGTDPYFFLDKSGEHFEIPAVAAFLSANTQTLKHIHDGAAKKKCAWKLDYTQGFNLYLTHLVTMKESTRKLAVEARFKAHHGGHAGAARSLKNIYAMARHGEADSLFVSGLVGVAMNHIADNALEAILRWDTPSLVKDLKVFRAALLKERSPFKRAERMFATEKCSGLHAFDGLIGEDFENQLKNIGVNERGALIFFITYRDDRAFYARTMDRYIDQYREKSFESKDNIEMGVSTPHRWYGRVYDPVDSQKAEELILKYADHYDLGGKPIKAELCFSLSDASSSPYFYECLISVSKIKVASDTEGTYAEWRKKMKLEIEKGNFIFYCGRDGGSSVKE